jgi:DNA invertase Pin-like site-specific DNA recombinase
LKDAVKSGASKEEVEKRKQQVKEGRKAIVQDKKEIREQKLGSTKDQSDAKQGTKSSKDTQ